MSELKMLEQSQHKNTLMIKFTSSFSGAKGHFTETSSEFVLCGLVKFQIKNKFYNQTDYTGNFTQQVLIKLAKLFQSDKHIYAITLEISSGSKFPKRTFNVSLSNSFDDASWQVFYEHGDIERYIRVLNLKLYMDISSKTFAGFSSLYDDTDLSDFELRGEDGSVSVHRAVLAHFSPVMKTMLSGQWKEVTEGAVEIPNMSKETLQQLKDFMYLQKLPKSEIEKLAEFASCYMMSDLEEACTVELLTSLSAENATATVELAAKCKMHTLLLVVMAIIQKKLIKVEDMISKYESKSAFSTETKK